MATVTKNRKCTHNGSRCQCDWLVRWRDADGKSKEKSFPWDKKTIATDWKKKVESDAIQGVRVVTSSVKFGPYAEQCIRQRTGTDSTKRRYMSVLKNHLGMLHEKKLIDVAKDKPGIRTLLLEILPSKGLSHSQIEIAHVVITSTVIRAVDDGEIDRHNLSRIRLPHDPDGESVDPDLIDMLTNEKITALAGAMPDQWYLAVWLARGCGLRVSEALGVRLSDFSDGWLTVRRQVSSGTSMTPLKGRKPGEGRHIPVPRFVAEKLAQHVSEHGVTDFLFTGSRSMYAPPTSFHAAFRKAVSDAGLPAEVRFHDLRHTYATRMIDNGIDSADVSGWLGHRDINLTRRVYTHWLPKTADRARAFLDSEWS